MKLKEITAWLDRELALEKFNDVSNNGLQIDRDGGEITCVAFGVDASVAFLERAAAAGAQLCVVHHGISWGGGIQRLVGPDYMIVRTAFRHDLALYGAHLPLDANRRCGNNWELARFLKLKKVRPAFAYRGNVIGVVGEVSRTADHRLGVQTVSLKKGQILGICSGGAGEEVVEAKALGCDLYLTGEASWQDVIAAENLAMPMVCCGHYETETFGVKKLAKLLAQALPIKTVFIGREGE